MTSPDLKSKYVSKRRALFALTTAGVWVLASTAHAMAPMSPESIAAIATVWPQCDGGWTELGRGRRGQVRAADIAPRISLLSRPSNDLDRVAGEDLYQMAKALLVPAMGTSTWTMDSKPSLTCPPRPKEGAALMEYLVGEGPNDWRGHTNAFEWLGLAYETGANGAPDKAKARRFYLRARIHTGLTRNNRWSDGIDGDLLANVDRAGLRPYLDDLAEAKRGGGAARMALAEDALAADPVKARRLLRYLDDPPLNRLLELENQKRVPTVSDADEIAFWAEATATLFGYRKYASRMLKSVLDLNDGTIPTSTQRPSIDKLRPYLNVERVAEADPTRDAIPVRALVTPDGRTIYIEACQAAFPQSMPLRNFNVQLDAARLYNAGNYTNLPKFPITKVNGRAVYSWVILPAVHFTYSSERKLDIRFTNVAADQCAYSSIADAPPPPIAPQKSGAKS